MQPIGKCQKPPKYMNLNKCLLFIVFLMFNTPSYSTKSLQQYMWDNRIVLIFAQSIEQPSVKQIQEIWHEQECSIEERDLIIGYFFTEDTSRLNKTLVTEHEALEIRQQFRIKDNDFSVVLIGKDGGAKYLDDKFDLQTIFALIDGMPMRRQEMLKQRSNC